MSSFILSLLAVLCFNVSSPWAPSARSFFIHLYIVHYCSAMGSEFTTPVERTLSPRLNNGTFQAFVPDTHHAYLLLRRAFQSLPPTVIPNMVPASPCGHGELDQPDYLRPASLPDARDIPPSPSPKDEDEENEIFKTVTGQDLPHRMANANLPPPVRHCAAPDAGMFRSIQIPNQSRSQARSCSSTSLYRKPS